MKVTPRVGAWSGVALVLVWFPLYLVAAIAAVMSPYGYSITGNALSDLGNPRAPAPWAFNAGCILAGLLTIPFGLGLGGSLGGKWGRATKVLLPLAGVALVGVGVFPEESPYNLHGTFSRVFFLLLAIAIGVLLRPFFASDTFRPVAAWIGVVAFGFALILVAADIGNLAFFHLAEHLAIYAALGWQMSVAAHLWRVSTVTGPMAAPA